MNLPNSDILNTKALARVFDNKSESYKLFWFKALLEKVGEGKTEITFEEIINTMIKEAWYMVSEYRLNLGPSDALEKLVNIAVAKSGLKSNEKTSVILDYLMNTEDKEIHRLKGQLTQNVPYRLQSAFLPEITQNIWSSISSTIAYINMQENLIYKFSEKKGREREVLINLEWFNYMTNNFGILQGWIDYNMIIYLQRRNPNVPGIASKLNAPKERKLTAATSYWKAVITATPEVFGKSIKNIYNNEDMNIKDVSIDHFVPWSYVAHDELWNLVPTTKSVNSSKSNSLPKWDYYFPELCTLEYQAYQLVQRYDHMRGLHKAYEKCLKENVNSDEVKYKLYGKENQSIDEFSRILEELILPSFESAKNLGFGEWVSNG